ncbi:MAG: hypothetical protein JNK35_00825 [Phycisphaerae bacterium]|nr:hypothetical protein [Phycisphaerae bacterium]
MAETSVKTGGGGGAAGRARPNWRAVWPVPLLAGALVLLAGGMVTAILRAPKADPLEPLREAKAALEAREFDRSIELINTRMLPAIAQGTIPEDAQAETLLTRARALSAGQAAMNIRHPENFRAIASDYGQALQLGAEILPQDVSDLAEANLALGNMARATELARGLPEGERERRLAILRKVVDASLASADVRYEQTLELLGEILDGSRDADERAWALARQGELRIAMGYNDEAIAMLLRAVPRVEDASAERRGELLLLLGRAYFAAEQFGAASRQVDAALATLPANAPQRAEALALSGRIMQASGRIAEARERFAEVRAEYANTGVLLPALLGLAETAAGEGDDEGAWEAYEALAVELGKGGERRRDVTPEALGQSLFDRFQDRETAGESAKALRYAQMSASAFAGAGEVPTEVLAGLARTYRTVAEMTLSEARETPTGRLPVDEISPVTQAEVKKHLLEAGGYFREHARRMVVSDVGGYRRSLWSAADSFDLGGDAESAKLAFKTYVDDTPPDDPLRAEARFRFAQLFEAEGDYVAAAAEYAALVEARGTSGHGAGPVADRAIVPLARCYLRDGIPDNDAAAETLLEGAVSGATLQPDSEVYRESLIELGEYAHSIGEFPRAIARLTEAAARYPQHPRASVFLFKLADAHRRSAAAIDRELEEAMPQARREELERLRAERLDQASVFFQRSIEGVNAKDPRRVSELERLVRRNATFYLADCAFERRDYARAIDLYDSARQRYADDPASLVSMVQIVNCYVAQQRWAEAVTANERARQHLASLPDDAWKSPDVPMERRHWERWLDASNVLNARRGAQAAVGGAGGSGGAAEGP